MEQAGHTAAALQQHRRATVCSPRCAPPAGRALSPCRPFAHFNLELPLPSLRTVVLRAALRASCPAGRRGLSPSNFLLMRMACNEAIGAIAHCCRDDWGVTN